MYVVNFKENAKFRVLSVYSTREMGSISYFKAYYWLLNDFSFTDLKQKPNMSKVYLQPTQSGTIVCRNCSIILTYATKRERDLKLSLHHKTHPHFNPKTEESNIIQTPRRPKLSNLLERDANKIKYLEKLRLELAQTKPPIEK